MAPLYLKRKEKTVHILFLDLMVVQAGIPTIILKHQALLLAEKELIWV